MKQPKLHSENPDLLCYETPTLLVSIPGGVKISGLDRLRVTLKIELPGKKWPYPLRSAVDLYNSEQTEKLIRKASEHFEMDTGEIREVFMGLTEALEDFRLKMLKEYQSPQKKIVELTKEEQRQAIAYLKGKDLMKRTMRDIGLSGVIGEEINRLLMFLVFTSRKLQNPLHIITLGASGTGKSHLQEKVSELIPEEDRIGVTSLSDNSLYYFTSGELDHRLLTIEDLDGASEEALYQIRELQTKKRLSRTVAARDSSGKVRTRTISVSGIVSVAGTTTREFIYEDNSNRSLLIHLDTSKKQDEAVMDYQRKLAAGMADKEKEQHVRALFQNCQRMLRPMKVINPYAAHLRLPDTVQKPRRAMALYLSFVEAITFYHQCQRQVKDGCVVTAVDDIWWANYLLKDVLLNKSDELSGAARSCLEAIKDYLSKKGTDSFSAREVKFALRLPASTLKRHIGEIHSCGFIRIISGGRYTGYEYRLCPEEDYGQIKSHVEQALASLSRITGRTNGRVPALPEVQ